MRAHAWRFAVICSAFTLFALGCSSQAPQGTQADRGRELTSSREGSNGTLNIFSCTTCHAEDRKPWLTGAPVRGMTERKSYWGGKEPQLLASINACRFYFMGSTQPWTKETPEAIAVYAYLKSLPALPGGTEAEPFTIVNPLTDLPLGDRTRGAVVYAGACATCHGERGTGKNRLSETYPILPSDTIRDHAYLKSRAATRLVFIQKIRNGTFLGYGGVMPPFSKEVLSDADLSALLGFFELSD
jgi:thiosulfate dehydrogenase